MTVLVQHQVHAQTQRASSISSITSIQRTSSNGTSVKLEYRSWIFKSPLMEMRSRRLSLTNQLILIDTFCFLLYHSSHSNKSIAYSQFFCLRRFCSDDQDFETKSLEMRSLFVQRDYPCDLLDTAIQCISFGHSEATFGHLITFNPLNFKVWDIITHNASIWKNDSKTSIFTDNPLIYFRRNKSIRDYSVFSTLKQNSLLPASTFFAVTPAVTRAFLG